MEVTIMSISFEKLVKIFEERGINSTTIKTKKIMGQETWKKIKNGTGNVDTRTINNICKELHMQPGEFMEWVDDDK